MADQEPVEIKNLDIYGNAALPWSRAHELLVRSLRAQPEDMTFFLGTIRPDGRPHSAPFGALWDDGNLYLVSGPDTQKSRNLAANPACTVSVKMQGLDLVLECEAQRVTDAPALERIAQLYRESGWPVEVDGDAFTAPYSAPSAGLPPWYLYRLTFDTAFGIATAEPNGATRWRFER